jgi:FtsH-binding integral membrane protein
MSITAMIIHTYFFAGLILLLVASLVMMWFQEGLSGGFIAAAIVVTLIVVPILAVFVHLAMHDLRVHGGFYDFIAGPGSPGGPFFGSAGRGW